MVFNHLLGSQGIDIFHGCLDILMPEQLLQLFEVTFISQVAGSAGVPVSMGTALHGPRDPCADGYFPYG